MPDRNPPRTREEIICDVAGVRLRDHESLVGYRFIFTPQQGVPIEAEIRLALIGELQVRFFTDTGHVVAWRRACSTDHFDTPRFYASSLWLRWRKMSGRFTLTEQGLKLRI